jgi:hypothetical protein
MLLDAAWTEKNSFSFGRDPLGMQATSVRIYRSLVPGLTNVTNRLRYYSFYCWAVDTWEKRVHADNATRWRAFIRRAEVLYAMASFVADPATSSGMGGREWAEDNVDAVLQSSELDLSAHDDPDAKDSYLQAKAGNFGQFYLASMLDSRMLAPSSGVPLVDKQLGRALASAFSAAVGHAAERAADAILAGRIPTAELKPLGEAMGPGHLKSGTEETELLRGYLGGVDGGHQAMARRSSAWLLLDYIKRAGKEGSEWGFRRSAYNQQLPDGTSYHPNGATVARWRAYQANELCHAAMASLFNGLMQAQVDGYPGGANPDDLISAYLSRISSELEDADRPWRSWAADEISDLFGREHDLETAIQPCLKYEENPAPTMAGLAQAVRLLAVLWARWADGQGGLTELVDRYAGPGGSSISAVLSTLSAAQEASVQEAIGLACRKHIIECHQGIAARKLATAGRDTFHFTMEDGVLSNGRRRAYDYTSPRLANLGRFLADALFIDGNLITPEGLEFLKEHEPA